MIEPVYPAQRRERGAERFAALEPFREKEQLLGVRDLRLLKVSVGFQPEICRQQVAFGEPGIRSIVSRES